MRRAVIVDDEPKSIEVLKTLVEHFVDGLEIVGTAGDIESAVDLINRVKPDLAFLDISLKEGDSFQILKKLKTIDFDVVFITAFDEITTRALRYSGIHCLFKPIDLTEFENTLATLDQAKEETGEAIEIATQLLQSKFSRIPVITPKGLIFISPDQINYIEPASNGTRIFFSDFTSMETGKSLQEMAGVLEGGNFVFLQNEYLINLKNIVVERTRPGRVTFRSGDELRLEPEAVQKILNHLAGR